jgi:hypothetical protein
MQSRIVEILANEPIKSVAQRIIDAVGYKARLGRDENGNDYLAYNDGELRVYLTPCMLALVINDQGSLVRCHSSLNLTEDEKLAEPLPYVEEVEFSVWVEEDGSLNMKDEDLPDSAYICDHYLHFEHGCVRILANMEYKFKFKGDQLVSLNVWPREVITINSKGCFKSFVDDLVKSNINASAFDDRVTVYFKTGSGGGVTFRPRDMERGAKVVVVNGVIAEARYL